MKRIVIPLEADFPYPDDVKRIVRVLADHDIDCSEINARELWARYSDSMAASWMDMRSLTDDEVWGCISLDVMQFAA